jgi:hypothetical protein
MIAEEPSARFSCANRLGQFRVLRFDTALRIAVAQILVLSALFL